MTTLAIASSKVSQFKCSPQPRGFFASSSIPSALIGTDNWKTKRNFAFRNRYSELVSVTVKDRIVFKMIYIMIW